MTDEQPKLGIVTKPKDCNTRQEALLLNISEELKQMNEILRQLVQVLISKVF